MTSKSGWTLFRAGGFDQVKLSSGADLERLSELDQKLWAALACPTSGLELDARTLALVDTDKDGRIRAPELLAAVKFACSHLKDPDDLRKGKDTFPLSAIDDKTQDGKILLSSAKQVLVNLGKKDDSVICADDLADPARIFLNTPFNGDGIVTELSTEDESVRNVIREIKDCVGSLLDRSGQTGVDASTVDAFFEEITAYCAWLDEATNLPTLLPIGQAKTSAAAAAVAAVGAKVDDYFARCRLASFDPRVQSLLNRKEDDYADILARDLSPSGVELSGFPLAMVGAGRSLPLADSVNPAYLDAIKTFREAAVVPLLGDRDQLSEADWRTLRGRLAGYEAWVGRKKGLRIEKLGEARAREIASSTARQTLVDLIAEDKALEAEAANLENVERLVRYYRDLYRLCTNFVNLQDFYDGGEPAVFQCGTLYLDQRACNLCLRVTDPAAHAGMAGLAGAYLAYAECSRQATGEKMHIVAAFTNGDSDNLMVGRNGLFYDRQGRDWDATITKIIDNPISIRQAFWAPYKKFVRMIEEQVAKRAAVADKESTANLNTAATHAVNTDAPAPAVEPKKIDVGTVAALGVAVGAIGTFLTALMGYATGVLKLGVFATLGAALGLMFLISLPSMVLAYITLRKRNLGPILDANGWAINANARVNVSFGATLTTLARLPPGSRREAQDRYTDEGFPWKRLAFAGLFLFVAYRWYEGTLDRFLPDYLHSVVVLGDFAPERPMPLPASSPAQPASTIVR